MVYRHLCNFWPLVPAIDIQTVHDVLKSDSSINHIVQDFDLPFTEFQEKYLSDTFIVPDSMKRQNMNILIVGDGLGCLVKSISRMYRHGSTNVNIFVVSNFPESIARNLLLLSLLCDPSSSIGALEKAEIFLEIFGNTLIRPSTSAYVESISAKMVDDIMCLNQPLKSVPAVSLSFLKQKEMDTVSEVFTFLKSKESDFDISKAWENAQRAYYGPRFDSRKNLFDYHFNMKLSHYPIINLKKYLEWCETGMAFRLRKARYDKPNKTLYINSITKQGKSTEFYGDITTSPYITFGVECKNEEMFQKANMEYTHTSEDISKFNLIDFMTEFITSKQSQVHKELRLHFLLHSILHKTEKFAKLFDAIYITCDMTSYADGGSITEILKDDGIVVFETINNVVNSTKEQKTKHLEDISSLAVKNGLKSAENMQLLKDNFKAFLRD